MAPGKQTLPESAYEVIVSDDGQGFPAESFCRQNYPWVRYTRGPQKGPAANRNNGASFARNAWLVFLDDDCLPDRFILEEYSFAALTYKGIKVFEGCILPIGNRLAFNYECPINTSGGLFWSCNLMVERELFLTIKGFDEDYPYASMEDIDFRLKILAFNSFLFLQKAIVHHPWKLIVDPVKKFDRAFQSHVIFLKKWPEKQLEFGIYTVIKKILYNLKEDVLPNFLRFKGAGIGYIFAYYRFLFKISFFKINL